MSSRVLIATKRAATQNETPQNEAADEGAAGGDVITDLLTAQQREGFGDELITGMAAALLFAGHETTVTRIDYGTLLLLTHPDQRTALQADPALAPGAVEEILRMAAPPGIGLPRYAHIDIHLDPDQGGSDQDGVTIHAGEAVLLAATPANRDPAVFPDPDRFDITRAPNPHLSFGHGPRFCLGASLARLELNAVFSALLQRIPTLTLAVPLDQLHQRTDLLTGGLTALPVTW